MKEHYRFKKIKTSIPNLIVVFFLLLNQSVVAQHIEEYLEDVYDQTWIIDKKIEGIKSNSYKTKTNKKSTTPERTVKYYNGIKIRGEYVVIDTTNNVLTDCFTEDEESCSKHQFSNNTNLLTQVSIAENTKKYYHYNDENQLQYVVHTMQYPDYPKLKTKSILVVFTRNSDGKIIKKIAKFFLTSIDSNKNNFDKINSLPSDSKTIWNYEYNLQNHLIECITVDMVKKNKTKRIRTVSINHSNDLPSEISWYSGEMSYKNMRFTRRFEYEFHE